MDVRSWIAVCSMVFLSDFVIHVATTTPSLCFILTYGSSPALPLLLSMTNRSLYQMGELENAINELDRLRGLNGRLQAFEASNSRGLGS